MAMRKGLPAKKANTDTRDTRHDFSGLIVCNADGTPRGGVLSPVGVNLVTATGTMNVSVGRFQGAAVRDSGVVLLANDGPANVLLDAAPAANSRLDVVWAKQNDSSTEVNVPDANDLPVFGVSKGTAGAIPVKPSIPDGALELATVEVPSTATATNSVGVVITQSAQFTAAAGGMVPFRTKSALELWVTAGPQQEASVLGDVGRYVRSGAAWVGGDTGWVACTLVSGFSGSIEIRRVGFDIKVRGTVTGTVPANSQTLLASFPLSFAPTETIPGSAIFPTGQHFGGVAITGAGNVYVRNNLTGSHAGATIAAAWFA